MGKSIMEILITLILFSIIFFTLVAPQATNLPGFAHKYCLYDTGNYAKNSDYQKNLNHILSTLPTGNGNGYGFYNLTYGEGIDRVHAIGQCRGDASQDFCRECLLNATLLLPQICPEQKDAGGWYDYCMVRYSNRSMSRGAASVNQYLRWNALRNASDVVGFTEALQGLLNSLKNKAASAGSLRKYAAGSTIAPDFRTIYGLVQCTTDLSQQDCNNCLDTGFGYLDCCVGNVNAGIIQSNCFFRYETGNLFFDPTVEDAPRNAPPPPEMLSTPPVVEPLPPPPLESGKGNGRKRSATVVIVGVSIALVSVIIISACIWLRIRKKKISNKFKTVSSHEHSEEIENPDFLQFSFETIRVATDNFSNENKLGQGEFRPVYKGKLSNGQVIAVKRLSKNSVQGDLEFKNEVTLVAKLQHRNLVRLLGFCLKQSERLLVYELVPNGSLDHLIFDPSKRATLDWEIRLKIIEGIARGLLYLHEDSRLRIIHRDLKASNIVLDEEMNPKISDFGTAKLFLVDQTQDNTSRIVGTYGYMAPEYAMHGRFSVKSDVFSFGVLLLEILSGQKNNNFRNIGDDEENLLRSAWKNWRNGTASNIVDPLGRQGPMSEILRYIHIALLCAQENEANRPTMNSVALMLNSNSLSLPMPTEPGFHIHDDSNNNGSNAPLYLSSGVFGSDDSIREPVQQSVNEASISELYPH